MASASSTFTGSENPLSESGVWDLPAAASASGMIQHKKVSGDAVATASGSQCLSRCTTPSFASDHYSEIVLGTGATNYPGVATRIQTDGKCYILFASPTGDVLALYRDDNNPPGLTALNALITHSPALAVGQTIRLWSVGSNHSIYINGSLITTISDATYSGGQPGIAGFANTVVGDIALASWAADDGVSGSVKSPIMALLAGMR